MLKNRRAIVLIIFIIGVMLCFWGTSRYPALSNKAAMSGTAAFDDPMTHQAHFEVPHKAPLYEKVFYTTLNWYETNWRGMVFGLVLAGAFLTLLSYLPKTSSDRRIKNSFMGMLVGTPLGVCVNCVAPIAKGIYEASRKLETALAVMFSSPTLNIVVLTMVFTIFPLYMALLKLATTFLLILFIVPFLSRMNPVPAKSVTASPVNEVCEIETRFSGSWSSAVSGAGRDYWSSFRYIFIRTVPLMLLAGFLGSLLSHLWSFEHLIGLEPDLVNLSFMAFMGTFMPLPIAFDIMLAQAMMMSGLAPGFVMTLLFTLGTFSIYSAMIIYNMFSLRLAVQLYLIVCVLGVGVGYVGNSYTNYRHVEWLSQFDQVMDGEQLEDVPSTEKLETDFSEWTKLAGSPAEQESEVFLRQENIIVESVPHTARVKTGDKKFTKSSGLDWGISYSNKITPRNFHDPLFFGRGIASGDIDRDGWTDLAVATDNGFQLYRNVNGKRFTELPVPMNHLMGLQGVSVALVDMNNDGWLDVLFTAFEGGNHIWLNPLGQGGQRGLIKVPNGAALLTSALGFADLNEDGFLDIVNGNYFLGVITRTPMDNSINQIVLNKNLKFEMSELPGIPGQTHSALFSDINGDGHLDLSIGNDYQVADTYYLGKGSGRFEKVTKQDGFIPVTTENTMSIDTGDIDNDLTPDIYLANIGFTKGIAVVSNIFGDDMQSAGREFCDSGESTLSSAECHHLLKLTTLLNPEKQNIAERCTLLADKADVRDCMVTRMFLLAAHRKDSRLCARISRGHPEGRNLCKYYFAKKLLEFDRDKEIPYQSFLNILLHGETDQKYEDVSKANGIETGEWSWNARFADLDNDEWQDIYVVNGVLITQEFTTNNFFHNQQGQGFSASEKEFGLYDRDHSSSYTYIDIDNDGDLDIISNTLYGPFNVYINNDTDGNSITFKLRDAGGNRDCVGCKVTIHYGPNEERRQMREIKMSGGFHSFDAPTVHFGLGEYESVERIDVYWSDGVTTTLDHHFSANIEYGIKREE
jgi:uncharacterized membrane protein YraQ (UPF0718 family)